jgi:rare lipoprotein A
MMMIAAIRAEYCLTSILAKRAMITKSPPLVAVLVLGFLLGPACAAEIKSDECGLASVYATATEETASGEDTLPEDFTAAHRTLPFGTLVQVDNQKSGRSTVVRITDRGPFISGRIIDLSQVAARALGISGLTQVCLNMPGSRPVGQK